MSTKTQAIAINPGDVFGYTAVFEEALKKIGQISPQEFAQRYAIRTEYLPQISFDPTTAKFWEEFNLDPEENNKNPKRKTKRFDDFRLNPAELARFQHNGFVVSERLRTSSFARAFFHIYRNDLPVFISADALLHAWHRSYDAILEELEENYLFKSLRHCLKNMADQLPEAWNQYSGGILRLSVIFADYFLTVARSLLAGTAVKSYLKQDALVTKTLALVKAQQLHTFNLFQRKRVMDFSQFQPRGHYENSKSLQQYFQAMMWCGRVDLRIAGTAEEASPQELGTAIVLYDLLKQSGSFEQWQQFEQLLQTFVGRTDSMTFAQLGEILEEAKIKSPADIKDLATLKKLQADILAGQVGTQSICSHYYESALNSEQFKLPSSFTMMGQKFTLDSWVMSKVVFDQILWNEKKVPRFVPSSLDVAFAVLGNNQVVPELVSRITNATGQKFRDGLNYQHNLAAAKAVVDEQNTAVWEESIYMAWLATLRELSAPTTEPQYPEAMRTRGWAMKTLNTQIASWMQLRHDNILYVKQSYDFNAVCEYPAGFVEPRIAFWERFEKMARLAANFIEQVPFPGSASKHIRDLQIKQAKFCKKFAQTLAVLKEIAEKQMAQLPLNQAETKFLRDIIEAEEEYGGSLQCTGWYPSLFYKGLWDSDKWDAIITDVHTNVPMPELGNPGSVLYQGVGNIDMLMIAVDNGEDKMVYAGPVLSHYEFEMPGVSRKSDSEWQEDINNGNVPPRPDWTKSYLC